MIGSTTAVPPRILVAKLGLDGHDVGAKVISRLLRENGFEVIYTGIRQTPDEVVQAALDEDVDVIGLSILSGAHRTLIPRVVQLLHERGQDIPVTAGGFIPPADQEYILSQGARALFSVATPLEEMVECLRKLAAPVQAAKRGSLNTGAGIWTILGQFAEFLLIDKDSGI
ncbi:MAG TPA: cobalamin B12-binding domain-containing protein [Dehalococcoidia bacterium]